MHDDQKKAIRNALKTLVSTYTIVSEQIELMIGVLNQALEPSAQVWSSVQDLRSGHGVGSPFVDYGTLSIKWRDNSCFLGNTLLFRFFERIAQSPNQYVTYVDLLEDVWGGRRDSATIRGVAKRLRDRLTANGMKDLAEAIDGSVPGYYGLILV